MTNSPKINFIIEVKIINFLLQNNFRFSTPTMAGHSPEPPPQSKKSHFQFSFFFKPLSVILPSPRASTDRETTRRARKRIQYRAEAGSVTAAEGQGGDAGAIFAPASIVGALSDGCAAMAG
jgi:hypothetical protein